MVKVRSIAAQRDAALTKLDTARQSYFRMLRAQDNIDRLRGYGSLTPGMKDDLRRSTQQHDTAKAEFLEAIR